MLVDLPGEIFDHLAVAIKAVPRKATGCTELGHPTHKDDGQTRIGRTRACIQSDRARVKTLVLREESLRKAVPAIARFVHFRRRKYMNVRERNELDPRWRHCVKTWKLAAGSRQGQREGLGAIAEEITAGNKIALVKTVINFGYRAA